LKRRGRKGGGERKILERIDEEEKKEGKKLKTRRGTDGRSSINRCWRKGKKRKSFSA